MCAASKEANAPGAGGNHAATFCVLLQPAVSRLNVAAVSQIQWPLSVAAPPTSFGSPNHSM